MYILFILHGIIMLLWWRSTRSCFAFWRSWSDPTFGDRGWKLRQLVSAVALHRDSQKHSPALAGALADTHWHSSDIKTLLVCVHGKGSCMCVCSKIVLCRLRVGVLSCLSLVASALWLVGVGPDAGILRSTSALIVIACCGAEVGVMLCACFVFAMFVVGVTATTRRGEGK